MTHKSKNNRRKTQDIVVVNRNTQDTKTIFDYEEVLIMVVSSESYSSIAPLANNILLMLRKIPVPEC
nr:5941_t:CDS:2 [Entrophospora candida]